MADANTTAAPEIDVNKAGGSNSKPLHILVDAESYNDGQLRIECAKAIIDSIGIFINECDEIPIANSLIHSALFGAAMLLEDASKGFSTKPSEVAA